MDELCYTCGAPALAHDISLGDSVKRFLGSLLVLALSAPILANSVQAPTQPSSATILSVFASVQENQGNPDVKVWVNTSTNVYHCPGTQWYGNTKHGTYMTQAEAQKKGYRPAYGKVCR
jgi:hypothetical protein